MTNKIRLSYGSSSHQGTRPYQEDTCYWLDTPKSGCIGFVLSDGMGGHASGDLASQTLVKAYREEFADLISMDTLVKTLRSSLERGNQLIREQVIAHPERDGMGATYVAGFVCNRRLQWISVGDSPLYLFSSEGLKQINQDHSMAPVLQQRVAKGEISQEQADSHPQRNALFSAVMGETIEMIDCPMESLPLEVGDVVIIASDGLQTLSDQEIESIIVRWREQGWQDDLTKLLLSAVMSKNNPQQDNVTIMAAALIPAAQLEPNLQANIVELSSNHVSWSELMREESHTVIDESSKSKNWFWEVVVVLFLVFAVGVGAYYYSNHFTKLPTHGVKVQDEPGFTVEKTIQPHEDPSAVNIHK